MRKEFSHNLVEDIVDLFRYPLTGQLADTPGDLTHLYYLFSLNTTNLFPTTNLSRATLFALVIE